MDQGLFSKYSNAIKKAKDSKETVLTLLQEKTGITFQPEEIIIAKKTIKLQTSSVKKNKCIQCNMKEFLQEKGYTLTM